MNYPVTIVTAVVDTHNLTMYTNTGECITVPQGDPRIRDLVAKMAPDLDAGLTYELTSEDMEGKNHYAEVEKQSNGLVRFFKLAKSKFKEIAERFCDLVKPQVLGKQATMETTVTGIKAEEAILSLGETSEIELPPEEHRPLTKGLAAVEAIMASADKSNHHSFNSVNEGETVVAVLSDNTVIHGVEQLEDQLKAVTAGVTSADGMQLFLNRAGSVKRGHSVEDLLKFVQKGELPFADDGSVLVYKRLSETNEPGVFVDVHSGRVKQRVGSFVHMAEGMVDPNRSQDCSNGLHVARRDYLHAFSGEVTVLCKLAPEDVIAVPRYDARKLRAKGYQIIARLSYEDAALVCSNKPMKDTELLANCIAGNHPPILEYVEITEAEGGGLKITAVESPEERAFAIVRKASSLEELPAVNPEAGVVDARALALDLAAAGTKDKTVVTTVEDGKVTKVETLAPVKNLNPAQKLAEAFTAAKTPSVKAQAARDLLAFKKSAKKSWTALGIPVAVWTEADELVKQLDAKPVEPMKAAVAPAPAVRKSKGKPAPKPTTRDTFAPKGSPLPKGKKMAMTQQEKMAYLVGLYEKNPDKANARAIFAFKQKAKKSWEVLGVTDKKFQAKITERAKL